MIEIRISKRLGEFTLEADLSLPSATVALFGPSGGGKSTLLHAVAGLIKPDSGRIAIDGDIVFDASAGIDVPPDRRGLGLVPQDGLLFPHKKVRDNLLYGFHRVKGRPRTIGLDDVVRVLEIESLLDRYPTNLSGGERQRVALGRALLTSPRLLLFDEPLASVDSPLKAKILSYLQRAISHFRIPALYVSHDHGEVTRLAEIIVVLHRGKVLAAGAYNSIIDLPPVYRVFTREGVDNVLKGTVTAEKPQEGYSEVRVGGTVFKVPPLPALKGMEVTMNIGADDIILSRSKPDRISTRNVLPGQVDRIAEVDGLLLVHIDVGCELIVELTPEAARELGLERGTEIWALIKSNAFTVDLPENQ